jgi:hypothetical protein
VNRNARAAGLIGAGVLITGASIWLLERHFTPEAQIGSMHRACLKEFADVAAKMKAGVQPGDAASGIVRGLSESLANLLEGMSGGMGDAVCDALRDACRNDFEGRICTAARERYLSQADAKGVREFGA